MSNEEKTNDYENFEKGMIYMKILKKGGGGGGGSREKGEEETKSMPHALSYTVSVDKLWTQNTRIIHDV